MAIFCRYCGNPLPQNAKFCRICGRTVPVLPSLQSVSYQQTSPIQTSQIQTSQIQGSGLAGELDLGELPFSGVPGVREAGWEILSPFRGLLHGAGSFLGGILRIFKNPLAILGTVLLTVLWFVLAKFRDSDSIIVKIFSFLTFSEGGFDRSVVGMLGGIFGKGTVAAAFISLFGGGLRNAFGGIKKIFTGHSEKRGVPGILAGILIGALVYFAFTGFQNSPASTAMAGIAGTLISLEALGKGGGKLYNLALSLTSKSAGGIRTPMRGRCDGLLIGISLGFIVAMILSSLVLGIKGYLG